MSLFLELKRRNVFKVAIAYTVVAWLILQVSEILVPALRLPDWVLSATVYFLMIGFLPALIFAWAFEMTPEGLKKEKDIDRSQSITQATGRKLDFTIIGLLAVAVIYLLFDKLGGEAPVTAPVEIADTAVQEPAPEPVPVGPPPKSIAVLPFANMSEDAGNEFFADGISEEILNALAKIKDLKVAGRTSSFAFKGRNEDLRLIGETLDVAHILEGSVRKAGNTVRITAQLIKVEDGYHLWTETYDRELTDIFAIQDEISAAILAELKAELMGEEQVASARTDPRAYEKYLRAKQLIYTRRTAPLEEARELLHEVIAMDEQFAPAWAERGVLAMLMSEDQYGSTPFDDAQAQAKGYLDRALELDENLPEALAGIGLNYSNQPGLDNQRKARDYLQRALDINPNLVNASNWLYAILTQDYEVQAGLDILEDLFERDPLYPPLLGNMDIAYLRIGRKAEYGEVLDRIEPFLADDPRYLSARASHLTAMGRPSQALPLAEAAHQRAPGLFWVSASLRRALFFIGELERAVEVDNPNPLMKVRALNYLGRNEEAVIDARQWFSRTAITAPLIEAMANAGQYQAITDFIDQNWGTVERFHRENLETPGFGQHGMLNAALAYRELGRDAEFENAMRLIREENERQTAAGIGWSYSYISEALYWVLAGDYERAIDFVVMSADDDLTVVTPFSRLFPILKPLEGMPRYEAVQQRTLEALNRERTEAGLEPLQPEHRL